MSELPHDDDGSQRAMSRQQALSLALSTLATGLLANCGPGAVGLRSAPLPNANQTVGGKALSGEWRVAMTRATSTTVAGAIVGRARVVVFEFRTPSHFYGWAFHVPASAGERPPKLAGTSIRLQSVQIASEGGGPATLSRPAGTFILLGFDGTNMSGELTFAPNSQFVAAHAALGAGLTDESTLALALSGAAIADYQTVRSHFPDAVVSDVVMIGMFGQTASDAVALKQLLPSSTAADLRGFLLRQITPAYVQSLRAAGLRDLTPGDVKALREAHSTAATVRHKTTAGERPSSSPLPVS